MVTNLQNGKMYRIFFMIQCLGIEEILKNTQICVWYEHLMLCKLIKKATIEGWVGALGLAHFLVFISSLPLTLPCRVSSVETHACLNLRGLKCPCSLVPSSHELLRHFACILMILC